MSSKMKPLIIFVALWIPAVYCRAQLAGWNSINHRHVGDPVEVKEVKKDQKASEKHEAVGLPLEKISKVISDHPVEGPKLKDEETVLLDSIRDELVEVENELKDVKTHLSESEDVAADLSQSDLNDSHLKEDEVTRMLYDANLEKNVEQMRRLTGITSDSKHGNLVKRDDGMPNAFEWPRDMFSPIWYQNCASCALFPFVDQLEFLYRQYTGENVQFSRQFGIDCTYGKYIDTNDNNTLKWSCGCGGGTNQIGPQFMKDKQYYPLSGAYTDGEYHGECSSQEARDTLCDVDSYGDMHKNGFTKLWLNDFIPLGKSEADVLKRLPVMPIWVGMYISGETFWAATDAAFTDSGCATYAAGHAMLLIGYDEKTLTFRNSHGVGLGDRGYMHIKRNENTLSCRYWENAQQLSVSYRRDIQYAKVPGGKKYGFREAREECKKMDTDTESGWDLAIIPTRMHHYQVMELFTSKKPDLEIHIGLVFFDQIAQWVDPLEEVNYIPGRIPKGSSFPPEKAQLTVWAKNRGALIFSNNWKRQAFVACSRFTTCWNFDTFIPHGIVEFDDESRKEGTVATIRCGEPFKLNGPASLTCKGGKWKDSEGKTYHPPSTPHLDARSERNDFPACKI